MSKQVEVEYKKIIKARGLWAGVRCLKNKGVSFENAYRVVFNQAPRR